MVILYLFESFFKKIYNKFLSWSILLHPQLNYRVDNKYIQKLKIVVKYTHSKSIFPC